MDLIIKKIIDKKEKEIISKEVLYDLPEWFGLPESTKEYIINRFWLAMQIMKLQVLSY